MLKLTAWYTANQWLWAGCHWPTTITIMMPHDDLQAMRSIVFKIYNLILSLWSVTSITLLNTHISQTTHNTQIACSSWQTHNIPFPWQVTGAFHAYHSLAVIKKRLYYIFKKYYLRPWLSQVHKVYKQYLQASLSFADQLSPPCWV